VHQIRINTTNYPIPSQWDDLSATQLRRIAWLSTLHKDGLALSKLFFFILTLHLPFWKRLRLQWFYLYQATTEERGDFLSLVESFREKPRLTTQKLEKIRVRTVLLHGPASGLANCSFFEYIQAEKYFLNYMEGTRNKKPGFDSAQPDNAVTLSGVEGWLNRLVATLYRPSDPMTKSHADDRRIPLTDAGIRFRLALVNRIDLSTKLAILMWFDGCRAQIIQAFPAIFPKPVKDDPNSPFRGSNGKRPPSGGSGGWIEMISELAGSPAEYERIGNTNLFTALTDISFRIRKNQELQREREAAARRRKK
jgi:hypothetical protein